MALASWRAGAGSGRVGAGRVARGAWGHGARAWLWVGAFGEAGRECFGAGSTGARDT